MINWNSFPFIRYVIFLIMGIVYHEHNPNPWIHWVWIAGGLLIFYSLIFFFKAAKYLDMLRFVRGLTGLFILFYLGGVVLQLHRIEQHPNHYSNFDRLHQFSGIVIGDVEDTDKYHRYLVEIEEVYVEDTIRTTFGKAHVYIRKDSTSLPRLVYGDGIIVQGRLSLIPPPKNPKVFDYRQYMQRHLVWSQAFVENEHVIKTGEKLRPGFLMLAQRARMKARNIIQSKIKKEREQQIAQALLLGIKDYIAPETKQAYVSAGAMHVLAVSGLHVGIVYLLIQVLFSRLKKIRQGQWIFICLSLAMIWFYAMITGLSSSVQRAAIMFSIILLSDLGGRQGNIYNSLGIAAFLLLLIDPFLIYAVGFQLSFLAVFGIAYLYPRIYSFLEFRMIVWDKIWSITAISIAAQIATFPLGIYYFHQFPTYFLISNLFVIPMAFIVVISGIPLLLVGIISPVLADMLGFLLTWVLFLVNEVVFWIESLPLSLIQGLYFDDLEVWIVYSMLLTLILGLSLRSFKVIIFAGVLFILFNVRTAINLWNAQDTNRIVVYELRKNLAMDLIKGQHVSLFLNHYSDENLGLLKYKIDPYRLSIGLPSVESDIKTFDQSNLFVRSGPMKMMQWNGLKFIILDGILEDYEVMKKIECDILIVSNNSVSELNSLMKNFDFRTLIINADNNYATIARLSMQSENEHSRTNYHSISRDGYWMLDLTH